MTGWRTLNGVFAVFVVASLTLLVSIGILALSEARSGGEALALVLPPIGVGVVVSLYCILAFRDDLSRRALSRRERRRWLVGFGALPQLIVPVYWIRYVRRGQH
jgi:hypothetical protein